MKDLNQIAAEAAIRVAHGLYNRVGNRIGLSLSELRHELEILESDEHSIQSAIEKATKQAWQEHDDVMDALAIANETIKQLGARNKQLREQPRHVEQAWTLLRAQLKKEGLSEGHVNQIIDGMNRDVAKSSAAHASEPKYDPNLTVLPEIMEAAVKVAHWATMNGFKKGWCIGPVSDRAAHASEPPRPYGFDTTESHASEDWMRNALRGQYPYIDEATDREVIDLIKQKLGAAHTSEQAERFPIEFHGDQNLSKEG